MIAMAFLRPLSTCFHNEFMRELI